MIKYVEITAREVGWRQAGGAPDAAWDTPVWTTPVDPTRRVKYMEHTGKMTELFLALTEELTLPLGVYSNDIEVVLQHAMQEAGLDPKRWDGVAVRGPNGLVGFYAIEPTICTWVIYAVGAPYFKTVPYLHLSDEWFVDEYVETLTATRSEYKELLRFEGTRAQANEKFAALRAKAPPIKSPDLEEWTAKLCEGLQVPRSLLESVSPTTKESCAFDLNLAPRSILVGSPGAHSAKMPGPGEVVLSPGPGQTLGQLLDEFLDKSSGPEMKYGVLTITGLKVEPKP